MADPVVKRALAYPYNIPDGSYLLTPDGFEELEDGVRLPDLRHRHPILATGSNQSPERLGDKFDGLMMEPIPVLKARLKNFDAVYSPHFSSYGSIPATLHPAPGVTVDLFVTWLNDAERDRMHETEALGQNYDYEELVGTPVEIDRVGEQENVFTYMGRRGALMHQDRPMALADVRAEGRLWSSATQIQVQELAREKLAPEKRLDQFILENINDVKVRRHRTDELSRDAKRPALR